MVWRVTVEKRTSLPHRANFFLIVAPGRCLMFADEVFGGCHLIFRTILS